MKSLFVVAWALSGASATLVKFDSPHFSPVPGISNREQIFIGLGLDSRDIDLVPGVLSKYGERHPAVVLPFGEATPERSHWLAADLRGSNLEAVELEVLSRGGQISVQMISSRIMAGYDRWFGNLGDEAVRMFPNMVFDPALVVEDLRFENKTSEASLNRYRHFLESKRQRFDQLDRMKKTRAFYMDMFGFTVADELNETAVQMEHYIKFLRVTNHTVRLRQMQIIKQDYLRFVDSAAERAKAGHETEDQEYKDYVQYLRSTEKNLTRIREMQVLKQDYLDFVKSRSHQEHVIATTAKGLREYMNHIRLHRPNHTQDQANHLHEVKHFYMGLLDYLAEKEEEEDGVVSGAGLQHYFDFLEATPEFSPELQLVRDVQDSYLAFVKNRTKLEARVSAKTSAPGLQEYLDYLKYSEKNLTKVMQMQKVKEEYLKFLNMKPGVADEGAAVQTQNPTAKPVPANSALAFSFDPDDESVRLPFEHLQNASEFTTHIFVNVPRPGNICQNLTAIALLKDVLEEKAGPDTMVVPDMCEGPIKITTPGADTMFVRRLEEETSKMQITIISPRHLVSSTMKSLAEAELDELTTTAQTRGFHARTSGVITPQSIKQLKAELNGLWSMRGALRHQKRSQMIPHVALLAVALLSVGLFARWSRRHRATPGGSHVPANADGGFEGFRPPAAAADDDDSEVE